MATISSQNPLTSTPFPKSEYDGRQQRVLEAVALAGLDALVVTSRNHLQYLTGYDGNGVYYAPFPLILMPGHAPTYVVREYDVETVRAESCIDEIVSYSYRRDFAKVCADVFRRHGLQNKRVGFQLGCWDLAPADVSALQAELPNLKMSDATQAVTSVVAVKSDLELEVMRDAMRITDLAVRTFQSSLQEGVTELEMEKILVAAIQSGAGKAGSGITLPHTTILFGERTKLPHGVPTPNSINKDEPAFLEVAGSKHGYSAWLVRCAVLGRHPETESLHALAEEVIDAVVAAAIPGATTGTVDAAGRKVLNRSGRQRVFRQRTGYQTGLSNARGDLSLEPGAEDTLKSGMTFHIPNILCSESGYLFGTGAHILVTERGAELLSDTPNKLYRA
ncbi:Xaa-Pro peptidase family protein [Mesorhizobium sp. M1334]|uniref:M24 family metallopeptidase n=1 Tax=Mesorhizobium sp. M1334 TaxID=2957084 RepID=UPI003339EB10